MYEVPIRHHPKRRCTAAGLILTDDAGNGDETLTIQPEPGSIVLTEGDFGTAWQRQFDSGLWKRIGGGQARDWKWLTTQRRLRLVYDAPPRTPSAEQLASLTPGAVEEYQKMHDMAARLSAAVERHNNQNGA